MNDITNDQHADLLEAAKSGGPLFPPGFVYRPPIENVCGCGAKHTGFFRNCPICQSAEAQRST